MERLLSSHWYDEICLFTPEDLDLMTAFSARNIQELVESSKYFVSAIITVDENSPLPLVPQRTNRPLLFKYKDGTIGGYSILSTYLNFALSELQKRIAYFNALADTVTDAVTVVDRDGAVICWNSVAEELYHLPAADILGKRIGEHFDIETLMVLKILDEGRMIRNTYHRPRPDTHVLINASPIRDAHGHIIGGIATEQDITQLVRLNEQLTTVDSFGLPHKRSG